MFAISLLLSHPQIAEAIEYEAEVPYIETAEEYVRRIFKDAPVMVEVARCESGLHQFKDGTLLRGHINPKDTGIFQINETYHLESSKRMGLNIHTLEGNVAYARHLYDQNGTRDWNASIKCWGS